MSKNRIKERLQLMQRPQNSQKLQIVSAQKGLVIDTHSIRLPQHRSTAQVMPDVQPEQMQAARERESSLRRDESCKTLGSVTKYSQSKQFSLAESKCSPGWPMGQTAPLQIQRNHPHLHASPSIGKLRNNMPVSHSVSSYRQEGKQSQSFAHSLKLNGGDWQTPIRAYQPSPQSVGKSSRMTQPVTLSRQQSVSEMKVNLPLPVSLNAPADSIQVIRVPNSPYPIYRTISKKELAPQGNAAQLQTPPSELQSAARSPVRLQSQHKLQQSPSPLKSLLKSSTVRQLASKCEDSIIKCTSFCQELEEETGKTPPVLMDKQKEQGRSVSPFLQTVSHQLQSIQSQRKQTELRISRRLDELSERASSIVRMYSQQSNPSPPSPKKILVVSKNQPATVPKPTHQTSQSKQIRANRHSATPKVQPHRNGYLQKENGGQQLRGLILSRIFI